MRAPRDVAKPSPRRGTQRVLRRGPPALLVLVLLLSPALSPVLGAGAQGKDPGWPPEAWQRGDLEELPLHHVAAILAGVTPDSPEGKQLEADLARLAAMPKPYPQVGEETLRGLAQAFWHQQQALRHLSPEERQLVTTADPAQPASDALQQALQRIDIAEVGRALAALDATSRAVLAHLEEAPPGLGTVLAEALGFPSDHGATASLPAATPEQVVDLIALASGASPSLRERGEAAQALRDAPDEGVAALALVLEGLLPFAAGAPSDPAALVALGRAMEVAQPVLELWSAAATAHRLVQPHPLRIPDPDADRPDLRLGTAAPPSPPGPAPDGGEALRELALLLGDGATAKQSHGVSQQLHEALPPEQVDAVARTLAAVSTYILAQQRANHAPVDPGQLHAWAEDLEAGIIPSPGTPEADALLAALPSMEALKEAEAARADLLAAVEDLVGSLAGPAPASHEPLHPCPDDVVSGFILAIDACGRDSTWDQQFLLAIDLGGDDAYNHRAGAPFDSGLNPFGQGNVSVPVNILLDLGGSDTYDARGEECAQGAACAMGIVPPVSVLVDWSGDGTQTNNTFLAGDRSQGHASGGGSPIGILVERVGQDAVLDSTYRAGDHSQGRVDGAAGSLGLLARVVGSNTTATGRFEAGNLSQGANAGSPASLAGLINVAGADAASNDTYRAGVNSQAHMGNAAAVTVPQTSAALLLDVAGPRSTSHDTYVAGTASRGHSAFRPDNGIQPGILRNPDLALFLDAVVPHAPDAPGLLPSLSSVVHLAPTMDLVAASNDTYRSLGEDNDPSYGRGLGLFVDIGGNDAYKVPDGQEWPANDRMWNTDASSECNHRTLLPACGMDLATHDDDRDAVPAIVEQLWSGFVTLWEADPHDAGKTPLPVPPAILVIPPTVNPANYAGLLDAPYAAVLTLGARDDSYGANFSAAIHIDLGGNDVHLGPTAAASGVLTFGSGDDGTIGLGGGAASTPQRLLSFLLDVAGDDRYGDPDLAGAQGFGSGGAAGLLFDLDGSDHYVANHTAQGVGLHGGWGVLVDATRATDDMNLFRAGAPSHGAGRDRGVGLLVATGSHNTFPTDTADDGTGASVNLGGNPLPTVGTPRVLLDGQEVTGALEVGTAYTFEADVSDPHGDDLVVCWVFEHGNRKQTKLCSTVEGTPGDDSERVASAVFSWNETRQARTVAPAQTVSYEVTVQASDPGGQFSQVKNKAVSVRNEPPRLLGDVLGPGRVRAGQEAAFQLPFEPASDMASPTSVVDWGDNSGETVSGSINWAHPGRGATARVPEGVPSQDGGPLGKPVLVIDREDPRFAIDGDDDTSLGFELGNRLAHLFIDLDGAPHVQRVDLLVQSQTDVWFSVETVDEAGLPVPQEVVRFEGTDDPQEVTIRLEGNPRLRGLILRQVQDGDASQGSVFIHEVRAFGPGAVHAWRDERSYEVSYTLVDAFGGRNTTTAQVTVDAASVLPSSVTPPFPVQAVEVAGRGAVHHVSIPFRPDAEHAGSPLACDADPVAPNELFVFSTQAVSGQVTIDWGDGNTSTAEVDDEEVACAGGGQKRIAFQHAWSQAREYQVTATFEEQGEDPVEKVLAVVHVERCFDLWSGSDPLMFLALGDAATTWHTDAAPYLALVDRGGDDRYIGQLAVPRTPLAVNSPAVVDDINTNEGARPSLVIDAGGDDDYIMALVALGPLGSQGFGHLGAAALLLDAAGDDRYNAPGRAQGAAFKHGAGALVDLGGDDAFNVLAADHPDLLAGLPHHPAPWGTWDGDRPPSLNASRGSLVPSSAHLVQGAAEEGIGILLLHGGHDVLVGGDRSQGYGARNNVASAANYALPDPDCLAPATVQSLNPPQVTPNLNGVLCVAGVETEYDPFADPTGNNCSGNAGGLPQIVVCSRSMVGLTSFLANGPRMGPGTGLLLRSGGSTAYAAGDWSQGASDVAGRGGLLDLSGGFFASAGQRAQGYTRDGTGILWSSGQHSLWADGRAQACAETRGLEPTGGPEPAAAPRSLAAYVAPGREQPSWGTECAPDAGPPTIDHDLLDVVGAAGPSLAWTGASAGLFGDELSALHDDEVTLLVDVDASLLDVASPLAAEVVAFVQPYGRWGDTCTGLPLSGPVRVPVVAGEATAEVTLDFSAELSDGPLLPSGCQRVRVLARGVQDGRAATGWSKLQGEFLALPSPRVAVDAATPPATSLPRLVTDGTDVVFDVATTQPLARPGGDATPDAEFVLRDGSGADSGATFTSGAWSAVPRGAGATRTYTISDLPPADPLPYTLWAQTRWGNEQWGGWKELAEVVVDDDAPTVTTDAMQTWWKGGPPVPVSGTVSDLGTGVEDLRVRLVKAACVEAGGSPEDCIARLRPPSLLVDDTCAGTQPEHKCVVEVIDATRGQQIHCGGDLCSTREFPEVREEVTAALHRNGDAWKWHTLLDVPDSQFPGGLLRVQVNATDGGGASTGWVNATGGIGVDRVAPDVATQSAQQTVATHQTFHPQPMNFTLTFDDCSVDRSVTQGGCVAGSGLDAATVVLLVRQPGGTVVALRAAEAEPDDASPVTVHVGFSWLGPAPDGDGEAGPVEGAYEVLVQARDHAGNFLSLNPGRTLFVDRTRPVVSAPVVDLPPDQQWIKPGDVLHVTVDALDVGDNATWIHNVTARLGGEEVVLQPLGEGSNTYGGSLNVTGLPDGVGSRVRVMAVDAAGNARTTQSDPLLFYAEPPAVQQSIEVRAQSILVDWSTDRAVTVTEARVEAGGQQVEGVVTGGPTQFQARFLDLAQGTPHDLFIHMTDAAGHATSITQSLTTPVRAEARLVLDDPPALTRSGNVSIAGTVVNPVHATLTLHLGSPDAPPLQTLTVEAGADAPFSFDINSIQVLPASTQQAVQATFAVVLDDQVLALQQTLEMRIDNAPPVLAPRVEGHAPTNGWYNRSVAVDAGSADDTGPVAHRVLVGQAWQERRSVRISHDGVHEVAFEAEDAAFLPNNHTATLTVRIDRTLPALALGTDLVHAATRAGTVNLTVSSADALSGLDGHRTRIDGGAWTAWGEAPTQVALEPGEGEQWIDVEARDAAGNVQRRSLSVLMDQTAPELLHAQWIGRSPDGEPVLQFIARDRIGGSGRPAGIDAVRVAAPNGTWGAWIPTNGVDALPVAEADGVLLQFRDRAGNPGPPAAVVRPEIADEQAPAAVAAPAARVASPAVAPARGDTSTLFVFSAVVVPPNGTVPDDVWLEVSGREVAMEPRGTPLEGGGRLYTASARLQASALDQPHRYRVMASFGDVVVASDDLPGPTVAASGVGGEPLAGSHRQAPGPAPLAALAALALIHGLCRRRRP